MSRTHDVTISAFDLDRIESELAAVTEQRDRLADQIEANHKGTLMLERMVYQLREQNDRLAEAIYKTIMENLHLTDGDDCTLKRLKDVIQFELPNE